MKHLLWLAGFFAFAAPPPIAAAATETLQLTPGNMLAETHSSALIFGVTGTFRDLHGTLVFDPDAKTCHFDVTFVVKSLSSPNAMVAGQVMSKDFLDPDDFPTQHYVGDCQPGGNQVVGQLTMRGQTHPFDMAITPEMTAGKLTAFHTEGKLNRFEWGIVSHTGTVGKMIRVTNDISLNGQPPQEAD